MQLDVDVLCTYCLHTVNLWRGSCAAGLGGDGERCGTPLRLLDW